MHPRSLRRAALAIAAACAIALAGTVLAPGTGSAHQTSDRSRHRLEIGVFGDMPYGPYGREHFPAVLTDINRARLDFSVFVGDTKNGSDPCFADPHPSDAGNPTADLAVADAAHPDVYKAALRAFNSLTRPLVYVPGDNEWTDCDRTTITDGRSSDSSDRLAYLRSLSYPTDRSLGRHTIRLTRQSARYPENVRWRRGPVTFIALNIPGSDNNFSLGGKEGPAAQAQAEYAARNAANLRWLRRGFASARNRHSEGVAIFIQADMWDPAASSLAHYADTKEELFRQTTSFRGQVLLVNGDSHHFVVDKPLTDYATTNAAGEDGPNTVENFTRTTGFGEDQNHWSSITVDRRDPNLFAVHQHIIRRNVPRYTPPAG
jgi:hypothetical protein